MSASGRTIGRLLVAALAASGLAREACATQHFVKPGSSLFRRPPVLRPGDEVILWPGNHDAIQLRGLVGTAEQPIVIKGLDPRTPPTIDADRFGLQLIGAKHVRIENLHVTGASIACIRIEPGEGIDRNEDVVISGVTIGPTEPKNTRHGLVVQATDGLRIEDVAAERWGGYGILLQDVTSATVRNVRLAGKSEHVQAGGLRVERGEHVRLEAVRVEDWDNWAIELAAVRMATIEGAEILGTDDREQIGGIRLDAGAQDVRVVGTFVRSPGDTGILVGGASSPDAARPIHPTGAPAEERLRFEAARVELERCRLVGGRAAVAFSHVLTAGVRACTIVDPRDFVLSLQSERKDGPASADLVISQCLATWAPGTFQGVLHLGPDLDPTPLRAEENLWWVQRPTAPTPAASPRPVPADGPGNGEAPAPLEIVFPFRLVFPQIADVDPRLDADLRPMNPDAVDFGAVPPPPPPPRREASADGIP